MTTRTRRPAQPRGGPRARAAAARRRVRTTNNANTPGLYRQRYRQIQRSGRRVGRLHRQMRHMSVAGATWGLLTLIVAVAAVAAQSTATGVAAGGSLAVTAGVERYKRRKGRSSVPPPRKQTPNPRGSGSSRSTPGTAGTAAQTKPKPVNLGGSSGARPKVCGKACQQSTHPKSTCRCTASDCKHGTLAGAATP